MFIQKLKLFKKFKDVYKRQDVRIVAATNESLEEKIQDGSFRKDLYYRLNALTVEIPPLRKRGDDIFLLLDYFMRKMGGDFTLSEGCLLYTSRCE